MYSVVRFLLILLLITSCNDKEIECVCTFEYAPVCANGTLFDNECIAKCNGVTEFSESEVCAIPPMEPCPEGMLCPQVMPSPRIYKNECEANIYKARIIEREMCP